MTPRLVVALLLAFPLRLALAQESSAPTSTITGLVVDSLSGKTLRGAIVYFTSGPGDVRTDREGRFRIQRQSTDDTVLVIRTIGYVPSYVKVPLSSSASVVDVGKIAIGAVATRLDQIAVEAEEIRLYPHLVDFYRRRQQGMGAQFFTPEEIQRSGTRSTVDLLYRGKSVQMDCPHDPVRRGDDRCVARDRRSPGYKVTSDPRDKCEKEIFLDGRLSTQKLEDIPIQDIAAIEIYAGPATTPANFGQRRCGVIAIWSHNGRQGPN